jgi:hypothetical protein
MKALIIILITCIAFSVNAQYVQPTRTITTEDLNLKAQKLTQQCVYLHIAEVSSSALGFILIIAAVNPLSGNINGGLATVGSVALLAGPVFGIIEWIKVSQAHNILSLGNPKVSFNSSPNGIGLAYNF